MSSTCTDAESIYVDLPNCPGQKSLPGLRDRCYSISKRDIEAWPTIPENPTTPAEGVTYVGDFTLAADKKWTYVGLCPNKNSVTCESQGEVGSKTFLNTATVVVPGIEENVSGYCDQMNNDEMVYIILQRNGKARVIGSEAFTPEITSSLASGEAVTDANATTITVAATDEHPAPFYPGVIETEDGDIDGSTGKTVTTEETTT